MLDIFLVTIKDLLDRAAEDVSDTDLATELTEASSTVEAYLNHETTDLV